MVILSVALYRYGAHYDKESRTASRVLRDRLICGGMRELESWRRYDAATGFHDRAGDLDGSWNRRRDL
jgi:hypothetical protein